MSTNKQLKTFVRKNTWLRQHMGLDFGWGNGYVLIPKEHPCYGVHYSDILVDIHGGLTWSAPLSEDWVRDVPDLTSADVGMWCVGFDTAHYEDTLLRWPQEAVEAETQRLCKQLQLITSKPESDVKL